MAAATLLVAATCLVTGVVGATLLRGYLLGRSDAQLRGFAHVAARIAGRAHLPPPPRTQRRQALPAQFLVELIAADGRARVLGGPVQTAARPRLPVAQLDQLGTPFTVPATGGAGPAWRVLVQRLPGGEHEVVAYSLGDLDNTVTRVEIADTVAGVFAVVLLAAIGLPLVRASLSPLAEIETTAAAIADGDLSRCIDHPSGKTEVGRLARALDTMLATIESAERLRQVIDNLIGNAIQHTPPESPVTITVTSVPDGVQLTVADQGPGMTAEQASHVFERFYRTDDARTRAAAAPGSAWRSRPP